MDEMDRRREERAQHRQERWEERWQRRNYRGSLFWPLIFIAIGIIFLLRNTGGLSGNAWELVLRLWPVLLIAGGLDGLYRGQGIVGPIFWAGMGVILLLSSLGLLIWNVWDIILRLWPLLFVALGLDLLVRRRPIWISFAALLVMAAIVTGALWYIGSGARAQSFPAQDVSQALGNATQASITLDPSAGSIIISSLGSSSSQLIAGKVQKARTENIQPHFSQNSDRASYSLSSEGIAMFYPNSSSQNWTWDFGLNPAIPIDLKVDMGAGNIQLDLKNLNISSLDVEMGIGKTTVFLPSAGLFSGTINGAIGEVEIIVPKGMELRLRSNSGITGVDVPGNYQHSDTLYTSPGYASAENRISLEVGQAIGNITVRMEP